MVRILLIVLFLFSNYCCVSAQETIFEPGRLALYASLFGTTTLDDYGLGTELGIMTPGRSFTAFGFFAARPYRRVYTESQGNNLYYQFREERFTVGVGGEYLRGFGEGNKGLFVQANMGYTWGNRGGVFEHQQKGWVLWPRAGLFLKISRAGLMKMGYGYQDIKSDDVAPHRVFIALSGFAESE
ncbi:hypothetical protein [Marinoscillum furvescens]|uniref:DUF3575 domain-containing protein n=1 Tax=Marinoscillum furvescens DSM 4134 TaxID=1122208 RepID=A0A3D9L165_MARFU|nr:hypothetical protein [Marinoscillum furvescens]RED96558.1 hypothetical protein C7460_11416 [Marinoscillum furvescens DSM 4134]